MIEVKHLKNSSLAGQKASFDKGRVTIGRSPGSDIEFDAYEDRLVSGQHAEIRLEGNSLVLVDLDSSNGTFIAGKRVSGREKIRSGEVVVLGEDGPEFSIHFQGISNPASSGGKKSSGIGLDTLMGVVNKARDEERQSSFLRLGVVVGVLLTVFVTGWFFIEQRNKTKLEEANNKSSADAREIAGSVAETEARKTARDVADKTARVTAEGTARKVADETARKTARGEAREVAEKRATEVARKEANYVAGERAGQVAKDVATRISEAKAKELSASFADVFPRIEPSVYPVFRRQSLGKGQGSIDVKGGGTAWVVSPGVLATNAHVAIDFNKLKANGGGLIVRTAGVGAKNLSITKVVIHPGYQLWAAMSQMYQPIDAGAFDFLRLFPACDVALMYVSKEDAESLGRPLNLATNESLYELKRGTPLAFLGYPVEGSTTGAMKRSEASSDVGQLSQSLSFFLEQSEVRRRQLLTYNLRTAGGASGSPVFNLQGQVVAVHNAGNYKMLGGERISQGTTNAGQRSDILREILYRQTKISMKERTANWHRDFLRTWQSSYSSDLAFRLLANKHVPALMGAAGRVRFARITKKIVFDLKPGERKVLTCQLTNDKAWFVVALPADKNNFGLLGLSGAATAKANSWLALGVFRKGKVKTDYKTTVFRSKGAKSSIKVEMAVFQLR